MLSKTTSEARKWILANPDEAAVILAEAAKIDVAIARNQLTQRTGLIEHVGIPDKALIVALEGVVPVIVEERFSKLGSDPVKALAELIDDSVGREAIKLDHNPVSNRSKLEQAAR